MRKSPIERAIEVAGSPAALGEMVGRRERQVYNIKKKGVIPVDWCPGIAKGTGIPLHELRPDVFQGPS